MTQVRAFRGIRYDPARVDLAEVIVPPYDVITAEGRETLYERDPHNAVRLELTRSVADEQSTDYSEVSETLSSWLKSGVLVQDDEPALYAFRQRFAGPDGEPRTREGFFAELGLADYSEGVVLPHERTLAGPKADRLKMLRATRANLSSVFVLYEDREEAIAAAISGAFDDPARCVTAVDDAGVEQTLAAITDPAAIGSIRELLAARPVVIADGHHRYETALAYRDEQRARLGHDPDAGCESTLAYFSNAFAPGSLLLPIHRVVRKSALPDANAWRARLTGWESKRVDGAEPEAMSALLAEHLAIHAGVPAFALDDGSGVLEIHWRAALAESASADDLMVSILEREILGEAFGLDIEAIRHGAVIFKQKPEVAAEEVRSGEGAVALYLNPLTPDDVFRVTRAGGLMPQKSTFFAPKIPTGLVFRLHGAPR
jgi:uncharacterized protein (DUF1015 family)